MKRSNQLLAALLMGTVLQTTAQPNAQPQSDRYEWPADTAVRNRLDKWQDQKFGILIHWGLYSQGGTLESWNLCSEPWVKRDSSIAYDAYKKWYWGLKDQFNPTQFDPDQWAQAAREAGMRYMIFTTKHHDGFNMFDTHQTDFKISNGPFANDPRADVAKYVFDAFRKKGFMIGAYFSKPDWHSEFFWWPRFATPDRYNNYDIRKFPWRWEKFQNFTFGQIHELMQDYGRIDILWLDGGWIRPLASVTEEVKGWGARIPDWDPDLNMPRIASMARALQPGILLVDRTVHGPYENYQTPEQRIPDQQLDHPWESCVTLTDNWGYIAADKYKSASAIIHLLIETVAKGGSLLLGVGPRPDGTLAPEAMAHLHQIGLWMGKNGEAIYGTRITKNFHQGDTWFTENRSRHLMYALAMLKVSEMVPPTLEWENNIPVRGSNMRFVPTGQLVKWSVAGNHVTVVLDQSVRKTGETAIALSFTPQRARQ